MNSNPLVSIVVPAYNAFCNIARFIDSILRQTYENLELIIVNDGSKDNTKEIIENYIKNNKNFKIKLINQENQGMTRARNNGYKISEGNYLWFLDSDMELPSGKEVEECVKKCENEKFDALMIPERSQGTGLWARARGFEKIINDDDINKNAVRFMKREVIKKVGLYNPILIAAEDFEFHNRVKRANFKFELIKNIFIYHHEVSSLRKMVKKAFNYGRTMPLYIKREPKESFQQFFILRPSYLRNWKLFLKDPISGSGLLIAKIIQYSAAGVGMIFYFLKRFK